MRWWRRDTHTGGRAEALQGRPPLSPVPAGARHTPSPPPPRGRSGGARRHKLLHGRAARISVGGAAIPTARHHAAPRGRQTGLVTRAPASPAADPGCGVCVCTPLGPWCGAGDPPRPPGLPRSSPGAGPAGLVTPPGDACVCQALPRRCWRMNNASDICHQYTAACYTAWPPRPPRGSAATPAPQHAAAGPPSDANTPPNTVVARG